MEFDHRSRRLDSRIPVRVVPTRQSPEEMARITRNISAGGLCFATPQPLVPGSICDLELTLPPEAGESQSHEVKLTAKVTWSEPQAESGQALVGIEFLKISLEDQRRLYRYLDEG